MLLERRRERFAVDEDEDLASFTVSRHRLDGFGKIRGDSFDCSLKSRRERVGVEEVVMVEDELESGSECCEAAGIVEGIGGRGSQFREGTVDGLHSCGYRGRWR